MSASTGAISLPTLVGHSLNRNRWDWDTLVIDHVPVRSVFQKPQYFSHYLHRSGLGVRNFILFSATNPSVILYFLQGENRFKLLFSVFLSLLFTNYHTKTPLAPSPNPPKHLGPSNFQTQAVNKMKVRHSEENYPDV